MKQDFYGVFYGKTKNAFMSEILSKILYLVYIFKFNFQKLRTRSKIVLCDNPKDIISKVYPKPDYEISLEMKTVDDSIDVSVIIPVYNHKDLISDCFDSVLNQKTKYKYELILVDDGSTDGAAKICDNYAKKDNRVVVIHQKNGGIASARNTGINNAKGKYIMFADCDDFVHDSFIETMLAEAYKTGNDIVICGYTLVKKQKGKVISKREIECSIHNLKGYKDSEDLIMNFQGLPWNKIYKREIFSDIRYIQGLWYEDTITYFLIFRKCKTFSYVNKTLYDYIWYENNFTHSQTKVVKKSLERYWFLEIMAEESRRIGLSLDRGFYKVLLRHSGKILHSGIYSLDENIKNAVFFMTCDLIEKYKPKEKYHLTYFEKKLEKALLGNNISKWELVSKYI